MITLLKEEHDGIEIKKRRARVQPTKGAGFSSKSLSHTQSKCHVCSKTVYPMEFVGASDKAFHRSCFRCTTCKKMLKPNDYCVSSDGVLCNFLPPNHCVWPKLADTVGHRLRALAAQTIPSSLGSAMFLSSDCHADTTCNIDDVVITAQAVSLFRSPQRSRT